MQGYQINIAVCSVMSQSLFEVGQYDAMKEASILTIDELSSKYGCNISDKRLNGLNNDQIKQLSSNNNNDTNIDYSDVLMGKELEKASRKTLIFMILSSTLCLIGLPLLIIQNSINAPQNTITILLILSIISMTFGCIFCCYSLLLSQSKNNLALKITSNTGEKCNVIRNGVETTIDAQELVIGDVVKLDMSFNVPADLRIIESTDDFVINCDAFLNLNGFKKDDTIQSVMKRDANVTENLNENDNILKISNLAWKHMTISEGKGHGIVIAIGSNTAYFKLCEFTTIE